MSQQIVAVPGRVRLKVAPAKCQYGCRQCLYDLFHDRKGVMGYKINKPAHSLVVRFDERQIGQEEILELLSRHGYCSPDLIASMKREDDALQETMKEVAITVGQAAIGAAIKTGTTPAFVPVFFSSLAKSIAIQAAKRSLVSVLT